MRHLTRTVCSIVALALFVAAPALAGKDHDHSGHSHAHGDHKHAHDHSAIEIGHEAPNFKLTDTAGNTHELAKYVAAGKTVVLEWFNPDCPFVKKHHAANKTMANTYSEFAGDDFVWLAINSGGPGKQGHGLERNKKALTEYDIDYPILIDEDGTVGRLYGAKTTPHMFVIQDGSFAYMGAIDNKRSAKQLGDQNYVMNALSAIEEGEPITTASTKPYGCSVKYTKKAAAIQ